MKQKRQIKNKNYENRQENVRKLKLPKIDVWRNKYADRDYWIDLNVPEFTCVCPKTGLPDFALLKIKYRPDFYCVELKSFKYYINSYRNIGIFHEHVVNKVLDDFVKACKPREALISGIFNSRGGIETTVSSGYIKK
ncbi:MAG: preQ(1) synthase [Candidatus Omnitrophica bacterium]|nr:preQ(1) synthase [Candidatus Omnitrophota bacterium]MBU1925715.1 preQ(1) synthase [Candidatus Omnitrophota bacterium]MBU2064200.1 preQ(1) synthase [Candidatus Omnitrophota bacterium]